jgi:hypothetical protein
MRMRAIDRNIDNLVEPDLARSRLLRVSALSVTLITPRRAHENRYSLAAAT